MYSLILLPVPNSESSDLTAINVFENVGITNIRQLCKQPLHSEFGQSLIHRKRKCKVHFRTTQWQMEN